MTLTLLDLQTQDLPIRAGDRRQWGQAIGSSAACAITDIARRHQGLSLVVTADTEQAEQLQRELRFFLASEHSSEANLEILHFPDWETLPYDTFSPHRDIVSRRLRTLYRLPSVRQGVLIVPVTTLLHRITPRHWLQGNSLMIRKGDTLDRDRYRQNLEAAGYSCVDTVLGHGEYALRGSLLDIFPMGSELPYRIDLFDDEVDTLRTFDPDSQRSLDNIDAIELLPAYEFPLDKAGREQFQKRFRESFDVDYRQCPMYVDIKQGIASPGIEYFLGLFFDQTETLFDHLPVKTLVIGSHDLQPAIKQFLTETNSRYENHRVNPERPLLAPALVFLNEDELFTHLLDYPRITLNEEPQPEKAGRLNLPTKALPEIAAEPRREQPLQRLSQFIEQNVGDTEVSSRILFTAETAGRRENLLELLAKANIRPTLVDSWQGFLANNSPIALTVGPIDRPLWLAHGLDLDKKRQNLILITESQILGSQVMQRRRRKTSTEDSTEQVIRNLSELREGAPVVHIDHGIGRFRGLVTLELDDQVQEFLQLEYADEAKLYVPVSSLHLIARYTGADDELAPISRLGSEQWSKARRKAAEKARDSAAELLDIYARREARDGFAFPGPDLDYDAFASGFPFETTPDQQVAINAVIADMSATKPMDRLVCGDVGFGKTEVAMRAAFLAVNGGKQVAILVPTTLLAQQHYESFRDRFADWPITTEVMSRFKSAKQLAEMKEKLSSGTIDIIIGTHKLLQSDIVFERLGLLIIDEEHRFGVRHKDQLKSLRSEVDILTLTATPIPRTLSMTLYGALDVSALDEMPAGRKRVRTWTVSTSGEDLERAHQAIRDEVQRGRQAFVVCPLVEESDRVEAASAIAEHRRLRRVFPDLRLGLLHGQMRSEEKRSVMEGFRSGDLDVLVSTTVIEVGVDVPNATIMVIRDADRFGLSQLHQLRGRVGRGAQPAQCVLLADPTTKEGTARISAMESMSDGYRLAEEDLRIRGHGTVFGARQSGFSDLRIADLLADVAELSAARQEAFDLVGADPRLDGHPDIREEVRVLLGDEVEWLFKS